MPLGQQCILGDPATPFRNSRGSVEVVMMIPSGIPVEPSGGVPAGDEADESLHLPHIRGSLNNDGIFRFPGDPHVLQILPRMRGPRNSGKTMLLCHDSIYTTERRRGLRIPRKQPYRRDPEN